MHLLFIKELFSSHAAAAICWTLIHSLWQGLILGIIAAFVLLLTKNSSPAFRYNVLSIQFLLFLITSLITFFRLWNDNTSTVIENLAANNAAAHYNTLQPFISIQSDGRHWLAQLSDFLSQHASLVAAIWFFILCAKCVKIISVLVYTQYARHYRTFQPPVLWKDKVDLLCRQLRIQKSVVLLESGIIKLPAVFGHLKPVIFIPVGLLANLQPQQVEAILIHELAHIRRNDYLFNLLQNVTECVFFFNPAILWISTLLRDERENCCDDVAITLTKDKKLFIESLISCSQFSQFTTSKYVMAFPGNKNSLVNRATRIVMNKNKSLNPAENIFLVISLVVISALTLAFSKKENGNIAKNDKTQNTITAPYVSKPIMPVEIKSTPDIKNNKQDTLPAEKKTASNPSVVAGTTTHDFTILNHSNMRSDDGTFLETIVFEEKNIIYKYVNANNVVIDFYVNGEKIPQNRMNEYDEIINEIKARLEILRAEQKKRDAEQVVRNKEQEKRNAEQAVRNQEQDKRNAEQAVRNKEQDKRNAEQVIRNQEQEKRNAEQVVRNQEQEKRNAEQAVSVNEQAKRNAENSIRTNEQEKRNAEQAIRNKEQEQRDAEQIIRNKEQEQRNAEQVMRNKEQEQRNAEQVIRNKEQEKRNAELKSLIEDLVNDGIIKSTKSLRSFRLNGDEFIVNGEKQSSEVQKKFKEKYLKSMQGEINYQNN